MSQRRCRPRDLRDPYGWFDTENERRTSTSYSQVMRTPDLLNRADQIDKAVRLLEDKLRQGPIESQRVSLRRRLALLTYERWWLKERIRALGQVAESPEINAANSDVSAKKP